jgi:5'-nucleotidase/UDP-sugar diphosphatase
MTQQSVRGARRSSFKLHALITTLILGLGSALACGDDVEDEIVLGQTSVDLELRESLTRNQECPLGNLITDALLERFKPQGAQIALVNGGGLRCPPEHDATQCKDWKIPAGPITQAHLDTVLSFDNELVIIELSGDQLRSTIERGVSGIPTLVKGYFLHVAGMTFKADCSLAAQQLDSAGTTIAAEGQRVTELMVGGSPYAAGSKYKVVVNAFVGSGQDGHLELGKPTASKTGVKEHEVIRAHLKAHSPVAPAAEGRITLTADCINKN